MPLSPAGLAQRGEKEGGPPQPQGGRLPGGGPAGRAPLVRALRAKQPNMRPAAREWLDRFARDRHAATAELLSLLLVVADVPLSPIIERDDLKDREPADVVHELVAALALEASEKGADFTQHWLVSRERGAARVRENFPQVWRDLASASPGQELLVTLAQTLRDWTLALSGCQFRSIRHAATVAGLHAVEGLSLQVARLREFCGAAAAQGAEGAPGAAARRTSLALEIQLAQRCLASTEAARDALGMHLVSHRTKDIDPEIRRSCFEAVRLWARADPDAFLDSRWTRYLFLGLADRHPGVRAPVLAALQEMFSGDPSSVPPKVRALAEDLRARVLNCCHDVDPAVGAAAVRCATQLAARGLLAEESFDPIIDLVWDPAAQRRCEAASFISRFVFTEDILDYQTNGAATCGPKAKTGSGSALARRRITMLLQFITEYAEGHFGLVDRLASALWRRASCIEDFEAMASIALPEGADAVSGDQHAALIHLADAVARLAFEDSVAAGKADGAAAHAQSVLEGAARALAPRVPELLTACQADASTMARAASLCRHVLRHCAAAPPGAAGACGGLVCGPAGHAAAEALRAAFLRQPDPDVLEHIAEALGHLLDLASEARIVVKGLAGALRGRFLELSQGFLTDAGAALAAPAPAGGHQQVPVQDALLSTATRMRILAKAFDVSLCDLRHFVASSLRVLDGRAEALAAGERPAAGPQLAVTLVELVVLVLTRHAAALLQPDPLFHCVAHDPIDADQLRLAPTAAEDLSTVVAALLKADPNVLVRTAAFTASVVLLTAWWNAAHFAGAAAGAVEAAESPPMLPLPGGLAAALCGHLGELLTEASAVPVDSGSFTGLTEPGDPLRPSVISQLFTVIQRATAASAASGPRGANGEVAVCAISNATRVQIAALACALVGACRHHDVAGGTLHSLVLSQALSPREDMQEVAWRLLGRLRREAHQQDGGPEAFFGALLRTVQVVHQDAGAEVAKDLSCRMLQHVGVGKLAPPLQSALVSSLKDGAAAALVDGAPEGLLEALVPWVTKNVVEDIFLKELIAWLERELGALGGGAAEQQERAARAGVPAFLEACHATAGRGQQRHAQEQEPQQQLAQEPFQPDPSTPAPAGGGSADAGRASPSPDVGGALPCPAAARPQALAPGGGPKRPRLE